MIEKKIGDRTIYKRKRAGMVIKTIIQLLIVLCLFLIPAMVISILATGN